MNKPNLVGWSSGSISNACCHRSSSRHHPNTRSVIAFARPHLPENSTLRSSLTVRQSVHDGLRLCLSVDPHDLPTPKYGKLTVYCLLAAMLNLEVGTDTMCY